MISRQRQSSFLACVVLVGALATTGTARAQRVVSIDGEDLVIAPVDGNASQRIPIGPAILSLAATDTHAYVLRLLGNGIVDEVDLQTGERVERLVLPCCAYLLAVTPNGRDLLVGSEELEDGSLAAFSLATGEELYTVPIAGSPRRILFDGEQVVTASSSSPLSTDFVVTVTRGDEVISADEVAGDIARFVYVPGTTGASHGDDGCAVSPPVGSSPWLLVILALPLLRVRWRLLTTLAVLLLAGGSASAKVLADNATMRIDLGAIQPALRPMVPRWPGQSHRAWEVRPERLE